MYPLECYISIILRICTEALGGLHALRDNARLRVNSQLFMFGRDKSTITATSPKLAR